MVCGGLWILLKSVRFAAVLLLLTSGKGLCASSGFVICLHKIQGVPAKLWGGSVVNWVFYCMRPHWYALFPSCLGLNLLRASPAWKHQKSSSVPVSRNTANWHDPNDRRNTSLLFQAAPEQGKQCVISLRFLYAAYKVSKHPLLRISVKFLSNTSSMYQWKAVFKSPHIPNPKYY